MTTGPKPVIVRRARRMTRKLGQDYDFLLTVGTMLLAIAIGLLFVGGTLYTFFAAQADPYWTESPMYGAYVQSMNSYLFPLLVATVLTLGLCIPRRVLARRALLIASVLMLVVTVTLPAVFDPRAAWLFLLATAAAIQLVVVVLTATRSSRVTYLQEGFLVRMGSALLHLGFVVLVGAFVLGLSIGGQLAVFWVGTGLIMLGMLMSLYSSEIGNLYKRIRGGSAEQ